MSSRDAIGLTSLIVWVLAPPLLVAAGFDAIPLTGWQTTLLTAVVIAAFAGLQWWLTPMIVYGDTLRPDPARVVAVRRTGAMRQEVITGGRISAVRWNWPTFRIEIYPGGLVFKMPMLPPCALLADEITHVEKTTFTRNIKIHHTSREIETPVVVDVLLGGAANVLLTLRDR